MSTLTTEFQPLGTELPVATFVRTAVAPAACVISLVLVTFAYGKPFTPLYVILAIVASLVSLHVFGELPLTSGRSIFVPRGTILANWVTVVCVLLLIAFVTKFSSLYSREVVLTWFVVTPFALRGAQALASWLLHKHVLPKTAVRTKVIVGATQIGCELARKVYENPWLGVVEGYFDDRGNGRLGGVSRNDILGGLANVAEYVKRNSINVVYIALPMTRDPRIMRMLDELRDTTASVYLVPSSLPFDWIQARVDCIGDIPVIAVCETPFYGINGVLKRAMDIVLSSLILVLISPFMLAIAIGVKRSSPGPVLFKQRRYGLDGKEILVYKFRTMSVCEDGDHIEQAKRNDGRITPLGRFLRKASLDELPQFINVLAGTMSIVGPRPHAVAHNELYRRVIDGYMIRHKVRPGITGWAQVNGFRGETEAVEKMKKRVEYDLDYLKHWSLSLDLWIIFRTVFVVLKSSNAY